MSDNCSVNDISIYGNINMIKNIHTVSISISNFTTLVIPQVILYLKYLNKIKYRLYVYTSKELKTFISKYANNHIFNFILLQNIKFELDNVIVPIISEIILSYIPVEDINIGIEYSYISKKLTTYEHIDYYIPYCEENNNEFVRVNINSQCICTKIIVSFVDVNNKYVDMLISYDLDAKNKHYIIDNIHIFEINTDQFIFSMKKLSDITYSLVIEYINTLTHKGESIHKKDFYKIH